MNTRRSFLKTLGILPFAPAAIAATAAKPAVTATGFGPIGTEDFNFSVSLYQDSRTGKLYRFDDDAGIWRAVT